MSVAKAPWLLVPASTGGDAAAAAGFTIDSSDLPAKDPQIIIFADCFCSSLGTAYLRIIGFMVETEQSERKLNHWNTCRRSTRCRQHCARTCSAGWCRNRD